jgi:photosystem II stability/assembly factor-like uncharacterized protein
MREHNVGPRENRLRSGRRIWGHFAFAVLLFLARATPAQQWSHVGPEGGLVVSMVATSSGAIFLGTPDGHIFVSEDGAAYWEQRGRVSSRADGVVAQIVATPYGGTLFAAVWYREAGAGGGVFRSDDGARSWSPAGLEGQVVRALETASAKQGDLLAGTRTGVFRSPDNGKTWQRISPADNQELQNIDSLAVDPRGSATIYAGTYHLPWKTTDGGAHWQVAGTGMIDDSDVMSLRVDSINPSRLYLSACSGIYRSENRGGSWIKLQGIPYGSRRTQSIVQDRDNPQTLFAATTQGLWLTQDAGENWKRTTPADWVINSVVILPATAGAKQKVIIGTEGQGILVSEDGGGNFLSSNAGFRHVVARQLTGDPQRSGHLLLLTGQDQRQLQETFDSGATWHLLAGIAAVRGKPERLDFKSVAQVYGTGCGWLLRTKSDQLFLIDENGSNWKELKLRWKLAPLVKPNPSKRKKSAVAAIAAPLKGRLLAVSRQYLFVALSSGVARCGFLGDCQPLSAFAQSGPIEAVHVSTDENHVLVLADGKLGISADGGLTAFWRDLPAGRPGRWVHYANEATGIVLGTSNGLYRSIDGGSTWTLLEHGLPTTRMQFWLETGDRFYVTTDQGGIYVSRDYGESWVRLNRESERNGIIGLVELSEGRIGVGSLSEGLLAFELMETP